jgi:hypothetical protein
MASLFTLVKGLPVLAACVMAGASYPPIPADLTTPVQQRIAINGADGESEGSRNRLKISSSWSPNILI